MTRLITAWIKDMEQRADSRSRHLEEKTGMDFLSLAAAVAKKTPGEVADAAKAITVAAVPVTAGLGIIDAFAQSISVIIAQMGFQTIVTKETDVAGIFEAKEKKADIVFLADDNRYIAINLSKRGFAENDHAVAKGYSVLLDAMAKKQHGNSLERKEVLLLGYGRLGKKLEKELLAMDAKLTIYDKDPAKEKDMDLGKMKDFLYIADATNTGGWITKEMLADNVLIVDPGIPPSLDEEAEIAYEQFCIHDNLEIGTVVMLALAMEGRDG